MKKYIVYIHLSQTEHEYVLVYANDKTEAEKLIRQDFKPVWITGITELKYTIGKKS